jgi:hypothetical protein
MIGVRIPAGAGNFSLRHVSRPALEPTQPPIQWVPGFLSLGVKRPGSKIDNSPPSRAENVCFTSTPPIPLHGVVLS